MTGIDSKPEEIATAQEWAAQSYSGHNVRFMSEDSHELPFPDSSFDLVYSHTVAHFFLDPQAALLEQKRVVKDGGWVVVSGVRIWPLCIRNPQCPNWDRVREAGDQATAATHELFIESGLSPKAFLAKQLAENPTYAVYSNPNAGAKVTGWLSSIGLRDISISVKTERPQFYGSEFMEASAWDGLPEDEPQNVFEEQINKNIADLISLGYIDSDTIQRAIEERNRWYENPESFFTSFLVFAAGRKEK